MRKFMDVELSRCAAELANLRTLPAEVIERERAGWEQALGDWIMEEAIIRQEQQYDEFLKSKRLVAHLSGISAEPDEIHPSLYAFQRDLVRWALRKGRCALFADTGLGKTFMQVEWARLTGKRTLIVAPLAVARQTVAEAQKIGAEVRYVRDQSAVDGHQLYITNYEMAERFDPAIFGAVVLDESSILKALDGKTRQRLTDLFEHTPFRLCCTATPAPNDITEIANHAEFLGIMSRVDMLSSFFVHDSMKKNNEGWRLKRHAEDPFYRWLASWSLSMQKPSDLGYSDDGYILPPLNVEPLWVDSQYKPDDALFAMGLHGLRDRIKARRASIEDRVAAVMDMVNGSRAQWILWCGLNDESDQLTANIPDAIEVKGADDPDAKAEALLAFAAGQHRVLVTKSRIAGFGMNFQRCHNMAFVGINDSWEAYYQCVRRCWRFGQEHPVKAVIVISHAEHDVLENLSRKDRQAQRMRTRLIEHVKEFEKEEIMTDTAAGKFEYQQEEASGDGWTLKLGDSVERLRELRNDSVGLSVFSPPFLSLYTYTPTERDLGNSNSPEQFWEHFRWIIDLLLEKTMPGRNCCVHVAQVPATLVHDGFIGLSDFRGDTIRKFADVGWIYHGEVCIDKDPQAQAIRTHSKGLLFVQLRKDASWLRPALADYILVFRKPGDNPEPVVPDISNDDWIEWARPIWYGIRETETLNVAEGRADQDERHICPLQLGTIERCIRLWSNQGDLVLSPFAGIGSEGYQAIRNGRRFVGIELKRSYWEAACRNLKRAEQQLGTLFATQEVTA